MHRADNFLDVELKKSEESVTRQFVNFFGFFVFLCHFKFFLSNAQFFQFVLGRNGSILNPKKEKKQKQSFWRWDASQIWR